MQYTLRWYDYITINIYQFGLSVVSQTLAPLVIPLLVQQFVGEAQKATYYGNLRLWGLMLALLAQAMWGLLSDHNTSRWGRRRPFILGGTLVSVVIALGIGLVGSVNLSGLTGYWLLFAVYLLLQISYNAGQGAAQGLIPDLVPAHHLGRVSAVKTLLEVPLPVILVSIVIAPLIVQGNFWGGILAACAILAVTMLMAMFVREQPIQEKPIPLNWRPFLRLVLMTGFFLVTILGMGELTRQFGSLFPNLNSIESRLLVMGGLGLAAILAAIGLGVWASIRIGLGGSGGGSFTGWVICRLAFMVGVTNLASFAVYFLQARLSLVKEQAAGPASQLLLVVGGTIFIMAAASGWLADKFSRRLLVSVAGLLAAVGTLIAIVSTNLGLIFLGGAFIGAGTGLFYTSSWALGTRLVPKLEAGRYLGISNLAGAGAGAVGAYIGGPIADYFTVNVPSQPGLGYVLLFGIYGLLFLFAILALVLVKEPPSAKMIVPD